MYKLHSNQNSYVVFLNLDNIGVAVCHCYHIQAVLWPVLLFGSDLSDRGSDVVKRIKEHDQQICSVRPE